MKKLWISVVGFIILMLTTTPSFGSDCAYGCDSGENCVNDVCVSNSPTPTPTHPPVSGCDPYSCANTGGLCVNNICVMRSTPTPTPTPTPTSGCNYLACFFQGGTCVNNVCVKTSATPIPVIKANGQDGPLTVSSATPVSITAGLTPGDQVGNLADWWVAATTPFGVYSLIASGWSPGINILIQCPLVSVSPMEILYGSLPAGEYAFYFGVRIGL